jgi:large subunit ribosomal protein L23
MKREPYQIIRRPIITEKSTRLMDTENKYEFRVNPDANKFQIKDAVQKLFSVTVVDVTTMNVKGKPRRHGRSRLPGKRSDWKRAIVKLREGDRIELF